MATTRIKNLTAHTTSLKPDDRFPVDINSPDATKSVKMSVLMASMGFRNFTAGTLPSGYAGGFIYVTDGRKVGEGVGAGTGVVCSWNGSNWITVDAGTTVAA